MPDDGWPDAYRAATARATATWADDARLDAMVEVPWGKIPSRFDLATPVRIFQRKHRGDG